MINGTRIENRVRVPRVAQRIGEQTADAQAFGRRPANVSDGGAVAIIVVGPRVSRVDPAGANGIIELADLAIALQPFAERVVRSALGSDGSFRDSGALFSENLDHAGQRPRPVNSALRSADDFNALDVVSGEIGKIKSALQPLIDRDAVEQHLCVLAA